MTMTVDNLIESLNRLSETGHGGTPIYAWLPGQWMEISKPCMPSGQNVYAMIELNVLGDRMYRDSNGAPGVDDNGAVIFRTGPMPFYVFIDTQNGAWRVVYNGRLQEQKFKSHGEANAHIDDLVRGLKQPFGAIET